jgi:hypothetical protein
LLVAKTSAAAQTPIMNVATATSNVHFKLNDRDMEVAPFAGLDNGAFETAPCPGF